MVNDFYLTNCEYFPTGHGEGIDNIQGVEKYAKRNHKRFFYNIYYNQVFLYIYLILTLK